MMKRRESHKTETSARCHYVEEERVLWVFYKTETTASCHYEEEKGVLQNRDYCTLSS